MSNTHSLKSNRTAAARVLADLEVPARRLSQAISGPVRVGSRKLESEAPRALPTESLLIQVASPTPQGPKGARTRATGLRRHVAFVLDRALLITAAVLLVGSASSLVVQQETGIGSEAVMRKLSRTEMPELSPLLVTGDVRVSGEGQQLHGWISGTRWRALAPEARRAAAEGLARNLSHAGIASADLYDHDALVLVIRNGQLTNAPGVTR
jgi:hypothetical protein